MPTSNNSRFRLSPLSLPVAWGILILAGVLSFLMFPDHLLVHKKSLWAKNSALQLTLAIE